MNIYLVRVGQGAKYASEARRLGFIAVGWDEVPNLIELGSLEKIRKALRKTTYEYSDQQIAVQAGQLVRFGLEIQPGDLILTPIGEGKFNVGKSAEYFFEDKPQGDCNYKHRRKMIWLDKVLDKEDMSTNLAYSLGSLLTVVSLGKYSEELEALISGERFTPAEEILHIRDVVLNALLDMDGREFELFIAHLLSAAGFQSEATVYVGDKGIDVNGTLNAEGMADIVLRVQVKRVGYSIGIKEIQQLRGALASAKGEHGCIITTSRFTAEAEEESMSPNKAVIKLIDGDDLATLILRHYDRLDEKYKDMLGIQRKTEIDYEDFFERRMDDKAEPLTERVNLKEKESEYDTLVCPAREDGFKSAFLGQNAWWAIRINPKTISSLKYLAIYQKAPISQITYYGEIEKIEPYKATSKYRIVLKGSPIKLKNPISRGKNRYLAPQSPRHALLQAILRAKTLEEVF